MRGIGELFVVLLAALSPMFYLAGSVDADELWKTGAGAAQAAAVVTIYRLWKTGSK